MLVCGLVANAQFILTPQVGATLSTLTDTNDSKMKVGIVAGANLEYPVTYALSFSGGLLYSMQGTKIKDADDATKMDYLNIPIVANLYFAKGWAIKAGIQPGFLLSAKHKVDGIGATKSEDIDNKDACKTFDLSIPLGLSYEYEKAVFDLRYNLGLTKVNKNGDDSYKNSVIQFTVGYKFAL